MIQKRQMLVWAAIGAMAFIIVTILIPGILVTKIEQMDVPIVQIKPKVKLKVAEKPVMISVYLTKQKTIETVPMEYYIRGVLAAEMPADFELEALKAQAIAARTYIVRRLVEKDYSNVPVKGAMVTDTVQHQAYLTEAQLKNRWGMFSYAAKIDKINRAVNETADRIITYDQMPIVATFFSTSNGYTENSEDYWGQKIPYLRSVPSPWDPRISPKYKQTVTFSYKDALQKLGVSAAVSTSTGNSVMKVIEKTEGNRIKQIKVGNQLFTGREVREKLGLNSSEFTWKVSGSKIQFTTYGYGHGVGMSQWGANAMAKDGKTADDILRYYYKGVGIEKATNYLKS